MLFVKKKKKKKKKTGTLGSILPPEAFAPPPEPVFCGKDENEEVIEHIAKKREAIKISDKGSEFYNEKKFRKALSYYNKAIAIYPDMPHFWRNKGYALEQMAHSEHLAGKLKKAIGYYKKAAEALEHSLELDLQDQNTWHVLGRIYEQINETEKSKECFDREKDLKK